MAEQVLLTNEEMHLRKLQREKEVEDLNEQIDIMQEQIYQTQLRLQQSETGVPQKTEGGVMEKERQDEHYANSV